MVTSNQKMKIPDLDHVPDSFRFFYFSELIKRPVCVGKVSHRIGKLSDLVFALAQPYPEAVGIYLEYGWGKPTAFIPWQKVSRIEDDAIFVEPPDRGGVYPPFVDQPGWILLDKHLLGRTVVDMDDRRVEVVNDVHLVESRGRLALVHVDISYGGFLRRWGLGKLSWIKDDLISWKFVQPLSVEDAVTTDKVSLSVTKKQLLEIPSEDLADMLEELEDEEQQALFAALDSEKAAETLVEAEPRAQRQIIMSLRQERARTILSEMSVPQIAALFTILPHEHVADLMKLLDREQAARVQAILSERETTARRMVSHDFLAMTRETRAGDALERIRRSGMEYHDISYIYVVNGEGRGLLGVVDLRELVLAADHTTMEELMASHVVTAEEDDTRDDLAEMFLKYHYRMIPVVDREDRILGIIRHSDIMAGVETRGRI
jgi:CBS domain-containing protein/sporulation protein YlmC with PRC-barrel domain